VPPPVFCELCDSLSSGVVLVVIIVRYRSAMSHKEDQDGELEALESIYCEELECKLASSLIILPRHSPKVSSNRQLFTFRCSHCARAARGVHDHAQVGALRRGRSREGRPRPVKVWIHAKLPRRRPGDRRGGVGRFRVGRRRGVLAHGVSRGAGKV
jgi:hypothetical protein